MRYSGIQPQYFPRLHYFARIMNTDLFIIRDEVQFVARHKYPDGKIGPSYQADTPIKQSSGTYLLHIPIVHGGLQPINKTKIAYTEKWALKHLQTIKYAYIKSAHYAEIYPDLEMLLKRKYETIADLNIATLIWGLLKLMEEPITDESLSLTFINKKLEEQKIFRLQKIIPGNTINAFKDKDTDKNQKIINALKELGANEDYCGETAFAAYMDKKQFEKNGITILIQDWGCAEYAQLYIRQQGFIANLSIIDLLMNVPINDARKILHNKN